MTNFRQPIALGIAMALAGGIATCKDKETQIAPEALPVETVKPTEVDTEVSVIKKEVDWTCDKYISFSSSGEYVGATKDCRDTLDVTREIRAIDPSLAEGDLHVLEYKVESDELLVGDGGNLWVVSGLFDYVEELPNAKVTGKRVKVQ